jgi:cleavage and polyadenylation specificity factor subunit 2
LGGTIWHLQHGQESIVYAVDWNQGREHVLSGAAWLGGAGGSGAEVVEQLRKPTALVCSSRGAEKVALSGGRKKRDELLLDMVRSAVAKGGVVLIPTDSSTRVLELAYLLEHAWREDATKHDVESPLTKAKLYLASKNCGATMRYARSMLEWMDESIVRELEAVTSNDNRQQGRPGGDPGSRRGGTRNDVQGPRASTKPTGPFDFKYLKLVERKKQIDRILDEATSGSQQGGHVLLASDTSMEWGFSKDVLRRIAADSRNLVILTDRQTREGSPEVSQHDGLAHRLWTMWEERVDGVAMEPGSAGENLEQVYAGGKDLAVVDIQRASLDQSETLIYQQYLATQRQLQNTLQGADQAALTATADAVDDHTSSSSSSTDESDSERQGKALNVATTLAHANRNKVNLTDEELGVSILLRRKGIYDYDVRGKKGREKMFPFVVKRRRGDDFGEFIRPEDYLKAEERDEIDGQDMRAAAGEKNGPRHGLGQKRKWDDLGQDGPKGRRSSQGYGKRRQTGQGQHDTNDEHATGAVRDGQEDDDAQVSDDEPEEPVAIGPAKLVRTTETVKANLRIAFVDFAGLHDKRSLQMLIPLIQPRKLILVSGLPSETEALAADCRRLLSAKAGGTEEAAAVGVFTPTVGATVDASVDTNAWVLKLSESLVKALHWQNVRGLGVVHITGVLAAAQAEQRDAELEQANVKKQKLIEDVSAPTLDDVSADPSPNSQAKEAPPVLDTIPTSMAAATRPIAQPLHVGDFRLADLRKILQGSGHAAEFRGEGTLLVDGLVAVRKTAIGKIEVEGGGIKPGNAYSRPGPEGSFYAVKRKIYEGLAVVAGG